eukprot:394744_1
MGPITVDIWNTTQSAVTSIFLTLYPFIICLLYQIQHEMASNPWRVQIRKMLLVTCLALQLAIFTFLRDQYVWNEQVNEQDQIPNPLLCGLSRFLYYGIIEIVTYYLIIMIIWDETEAQSISTHQLNVKIVSHLRHKYKDKRFHFSTVFKIYTFCIALIALTPSSLLPTSIRDQFLDGIDSNYRCQISNMANLLSIIGKLLFLFLAIQSSIQLRNVEARHVQSNTISYFLMLPLCVSCSIFVTFNETNWINVLSLDTARKIGFIAAVLFAVSMISNHVMMQSQAKQHIVSGARRVSTLIVKAGQSARQSIMRTSLFKANKIEIESMIEEVSNESSKTCTNEPIADRFSIREIAADQYDSVVIKHDQNDTVKLLQKKDNENSDEVMGNAVIEVKQAEENVKESEDNEPTDVKLNCQ